MTNDTTDVVETIEKPPKLAAKMLAGIVSVLKHKRVQGAVVAAVGLCWATFIPGGQVPGGLLLSTGLGWIGYGVIDNSIKESQTQKDKK